MSEVESTIARVSAYHGVDGSFITHTTKGGFRTNYVGDTKDGGKIMNEALTLTAKAKILIRDLDPSNDLTFLRIKTKSKELMIAPDKEFMYIILQNFAKDKNVDN